MRSFPADTVRPSRQTGQNLEIRRMGNKWVDADGTELEVEVEEEEEIDLEYDRQVDLMTSTP